MAKFYFKANGILSLIALLGLVTFLSLGFWQIQRSQQKRLVIQSLQKQRQQTPQPLQKLLFENKVQQYQPVIVKGQYDNQQQFLLDNKIHKGRVGYEVLTPLKLQNSDQYVLINRGWIPAGHSRAQLPKLPTVLGTQTFHGMIRKPLGKTLVLKKQQFTQVQWPVRMQRMDFSKMQQLLAKPIYPFVVLLNKNAAHGFVREWSFINMKPAKHLAYASQWFVFAVVLIIIYLGLTIKRENNDAESRQNQK